MKWIKYLLVLLVAAGLLFAFLANRDLTKMYGGLTEAVDVTAFQPEGGPFAVINVSVLSQDSERFIPNQTVVIENGTIVAVGAALPPGTGVRVIDGQGKYLIPGLIDAHVHLFKSPNDLLLYVANGVTQIRELIGEEDHLTWKQEIQDGRIGPEMFVASPRIGSFEPLEGWFMTWSQGFLNISDAGQAETEVGRLHDLGYDAVKIYSQINRETYFAVVAAASARGMRVVGHVPFSVELKDLYPDQESIAHLEEIMNAINREFGRFRSTTSDEFLTFVEQRSDEVAEELARNNIAVSTTLWLIESIVRQKFDLDAVLADVELEYENPGISEWTPRVPQGGLGWLPGVNRYQRPDEQLTAEQAVSRRTYWDAYAKACQIVLRSLVRHDVTLMTGTDANLPPMVAGFSLHDEFVSLHNAGMSPAQILAAATSQPAAWLDSNAGLVAPGRKANLVLLDENPLSDIRNTRAINAVILNGQFLDRTLLDNLLDQVKAANDASRKQDIGKYVN